MSVCVKHRAQAHELVRPSLLSSSFCFSLIWEACTALFTWPALSSSMCKSCEGHTQMTYFSGYQPWQPPRKLVVTNLFVY